MIGFAHGPLLTVHWKMFTPTLIPLTLVVGLVALLKAPVPCTKVHRPVAGKISELASSDPVVVGVQRIRPLPASATGLFGSKTNTSTKSVVTPGEQGPLSTVHVNRFKPMLKLKATVFGSNRS